MIERVKIILALFVLGSVLVFSAMVIKNSVGTTLVEAKIPNSCGSWKVYYAEIADPLMRFIERSLFLAGMSSITVAGVIYVIYTEKERGIDRSGFRNIE